MLEIAPATLYVVIFILQQRLVEAQYCRQLLVWGFAFDDCAEHARQSLQLSLVSRAGREALEFFEQCCLGSRRSKLSLLDAEMLEYLVNRGITDVIDQLERAKPRERVGWLNDHTQKRKRILDVRRFRKPDPAKLAKRNALPAKLDLQVE